MLLVFMLCLGLLTHSLPVSCINLHNAHYFYLLIFTNSIFTPFVVFLNERAMCYLEKFHFKITIIIIIMQCILTLVDAMVNISLKINVYN